MVMFGRFLKPLDDPLCHGTLSGASTAIHQHHWSLADCEVVQDVVEPLERALGKRVRARIENELKWAVLHSQELAKTADFRARRDERALLHEL